MLSKKKNSSSNHIKCIFLIFIIIERGLTVVGAASIAVGIVVFVVIMIPMILLCHKYIKKKCRGMMLDFFRLFPFFIYDISPGFQYHLIQKFTCVIQHITTVYALLIFGNTTIFPIYGIVVLLNFNVLCNCRFS